MPIGLNYTHEPLAQGILLPNYAYILDKYHPLDWGKLFTKDEHETKKFLHYIDQGYLPEVLHSEDAEQYFDARWIREILAEAYPYEVEMKCLGHTIENDTIRNQHLITLFNTFFDVDYHAILEEYCQSCDRGGSYQTFLASREHTYNDRDKVVQLYIDFVDKLLRSQGYVAEAEGLVAFAKTKLHIRYVSGISGVTTERDGAVYIEVGNDTCTTLFHELTHFVNRFFRYHYYENYEVCFDHFTRTNEGLSNFVAYHLHQQIMQGDIEGVDGLATDSFFFSFYIDIYATLLEEGNHKRSHNFELIEHELKKFLTGLRTPEKNDFYIQRFYKFFHYDQHTYFYPKEMMYYLGYHQIRKMFAESENKQQLLTQGLLGKVCL